LLLGDPGAPIHRIVVTLEPTVAAIRQARHAKGAMLVTHHPLWRQPAKTIDTASPTGRVIAAAIRQNVALVACHTNADRAPGGVNDVLAERLGLRDVRLWEPVYSEGYHKLAVFVPEGHLSAVSKAIFAAGGGVIGRYAQCSYRLRGEGTYVPLAGADPFSGAVNKLSVEPEVRLEVRVPSARVEAVLQAMKTAHPYEEVAFDLYPTSRQGLAGGHGRIGALPKPQTLAAFAKGAAKELDVRWPRVIGDPQAIIRRIVVCAGSAASSAPRLAGQKGLAFVTGDVKYHEARLARELRVPVVDLGHYGTERPFVGALAERLRAALAPLPVRVGDPEGDPFVDV
jgi:dinuclear metal center YbgI/SA1388 family protein